MSPPIGWNIVFDILLELLNEGPTVAVGFADDGTVLVSGVDPKTLRSIMQKALRKAEQWAEMAGVHFSVEKTVYMLFTNKYKPAP